MPRAGSGELGAVVLLDDEHARHARECGGELLRTHRRTAASTRGGRGRRGAAQAPAHRTGGRAPGQHRDSPSPLDVRPVLTVVVHCELAQALVELCAVVGGGLDGVPYSLCSEAVGGGGSPGVPARPSARRPTRCWCSDGSVRRPPRHRRRAQGRSAGGAMSPGSGPGTGRRARSGGLQAVGEVDRPLGGRTRSRPPSWRHHQVRGVAAGRRARC